eukprot:scaffold44768_cov49-Cyclotella_meneghiniana.AAC.6
MLTENGMKNNQAGGEKVLDDGDKCFVNPNEKLFEKLWNGEYYFKMKEHVAFANTATVTVYHTYMINRAVGGDGLLLGWKDD